MPKVLCPRCGGLGYWERRRRGEHEYIYVVHRAGGKVSRCYLGAAAYDYVERFNQLGLSGAADELRFERYAESLVARLTASQLRRLRELVEARLAELRV